MMSKATPSPWSVAVGRNLLGVGVGLVFFFANSQALAQMRPMSDEEMDTFLAGKRNAIMAVLKRDGSPQVNPMSYLWDGEKFWISTTKDRAKYHNLKRDPRITLCIDERESFTTVIASGKAEITEENLWEQTHKVLERYRGPEATATYIKNMRDNGERRVLLVLKPEKIITWTRP